MKINKKIMLAVAVFFSFSAMSVKASSVSVVPAGQTVVNVGDTFVLDLIIDFSASPTLGGGIDINYDSTMVEFVKFEFDSDFLKLSDPLLTCPGANNCSPIDQTGKGKVENIVLGNFMGIDNKHTVGTLSYILNDYAFTSINPAVTTASGGPFVSATTNEPMSLNLYGVNLHNGVISQSGGIPSVPIPATMWLFISGLFPLLLKAARVTKGINGEKL